MESAQWVTGLEVARSAPQMYIGPAEYAHLRQPIRSPLVAMWEKNVFRDPESAVIAVSSHHCHVRCYAGPLVEPLQELVPWGKCDSLLGALGRAARRVQNGEAPETSSFSSPTFGFAEYASVLCLANRGLIGIRTDSGLWCQAYEHGGPRTPPFLVADRASVGLVLAVALSPEWFHGLPYELSAVERGIPAAAKPYVTLEWHDEDDLVPECSVDPRCVLHPENVDRWL